MPVDAFFSMLLMHFSVDAFGVTISSLVTFVNWVRIFFIYHYIILNVMLDELAATQTTCLTIGSETGY